MKQIVLTLGAPNDEQGKFKPDGGGSARVYIRLFIFIMMV